MRLREGVLAGILIVALQSGAALAQEVPPPDDRVAQVGAVAISRAGFDHWFAAASRSQYERPVEMVGPGYEECVAAKHKQRVAKGWKKLGTRELRARCARDHRSLRRQVMQFLIQGQWIEQEAAAVGITLSEQRVRQIFKRQKRAAFPDERGYRRFLRQSGAAKVDILYRIRLDTLQTRLMRRVARQGEISLGGYIERFRKRYRAMTWCADGYAVAECGAISPPS